MTKPRLRALAAIALAALVTSANGCMTMTRERLLIDSNLVKEGMTEKEVIAILGYPVRSLPPMGWPQVLPRRARWEVKEGPEYGEDVVTVDVTFDEMRRVVTKKVLSYRSKVNPADLTLNNPGFERDPGRSGN